MANIENMAEIPPPEEAKGPKGEINPNQKGKSSAEIMRELSWGGESPQASAASAGEKSSVVPGVSESVDAITKLSWGGKVPEVNALLVANPEVYGDGFRAEGRAISRALVGLMAEDYEVKYSAQNRDQIDQLVAQWKDWVRRKRERFTSRKPFDEDTTIVPPPENLPVQDLDGLDTPEELLNQYDSLLGQDVPQEHIDQVKADLGKYFIEARRVGLFKNIDTSLKGIYKDMETLMTEHKLELDEVKEDRDGRPGADRRINQLKNIARTNFLALRSNGAASNKLNGVWNAYIDLTYRRFQSSADSFGFEGEFKFEEETGEDYSDMARQKELYWRPTYASYYEVTARTPEQFNTAMETFVQWARRALSKDPNEVFGKLGGFKEAVTTAGQRAGVDVIELRYQLEGLIGVMGGDWANEHYNADHYYQFMWAATKDEGPERFVSLSKMGKGRLAGILWKLDNDPKYEMLYAPQGSRGEFMKERNSVEMLRLQDQIEEMLIEEALGMEIKGYDLGDRRKRLGNEFRDGRRDPFADNLDALVKFQSDENFKELFNGFDITDQERLLDELTKRARATEIADQYKKGIAPVLSQEDRQVYKDWQEGKLSSLAKSEMKTLEILSRAREIRKKLKAGIDPDDPVKGFKGYEKRMYDDAKDVVQLTLELYGVMAEKAKRGAVFIVDRKDASGKEFKDYIPIHWAEKFVQFAENWTKAEYGHLRAADLKYKVDQARRMAIWQIKTYGYEAKLFDFTLLRDGRPVDPNTLGYTKYGQDENKTNPIERYRYAVPENSKILGYNSRGEVVRLAFDNNGRPVGLEFDSSGQAVIYNKKPGEKGRGRIVFDNLNRNTIAEPMLLRTPVGDIDPETGKMTVDRVDRVHVDFNTATRHLYSRWTGHPYWGYQEEDTGMILTPESIAAARRIRDGISRPEDEEPHATQLLIVDPTLERVSHFAYRESREDKVALAAVEESYQAHFRIQDELHQAFYPENADDENNRIAVIIQDRGGSSQEFLQARAFSARWTDMKMRRMRTLIPHLPVHWASMSEMWGAGSALGTLRMMNKKDSEYRMVGQFPLEKWVNQIMPAQDVLDSLWGFRNQQEKRDREGLGEKPTNEADILQKWRQKEQEGLLKNDRYENEENQFLIDVRGTLGRFENTMHRIKVHESSVRSERAPLWLEGVEIFERNPDGSIKIVNGEKVFNRAIDKMRDSGTSRHSGDVFFWKFVRWLRSDKPGEGQALYPDAAIYYALMDQTPAASKRVDGGPQTRWDWLLGKINR